WHVRVGCAVFIGIAFHQAIAGHVEVVFRIFVVRKSRRDKCEHESTINAYAIEDTQYISEFTCLQAFVTYIVTIQLEGIIKVNNGPTLQIGRASCRESGMADRI